MSGDIWRPKQSLGRMRVLARASVCDQTGFSCEGWSEHRKFSRLPLSLYRARGGQATVCGHCFYFIIRVNSGFEEKAQTKASGLPSERLTGRPELHRQFGARRWRGAGIQAESCGS
jgi:hypothetical protein